MRFLFPFALVWLLSIPVLVWLWRLASTRHHIRVPSLVPFEHLAKRSPRRRRRVIVNWLFWLQLAALASAALALAQPAIRQHAATTLVIVDTSASMEAEGRGGSRWDQARRALKTRVARKSPTERWFLIATAPVVPLTPEPTSEGSVLVRAIDDARVQRLGGNLSTAARLGRALLGGDPDRILVVTDEPPPQEPLPDMVEWISVGQPRANVGLVGVDAQGAFCGREAPRVVATIQNFSNEPASITLSAFHERQRLSDISDELPPGGRRAITLSLPAVTGAVELRLTVPRDGLKADNHARVRVSSHGPLPVWLRASSPAIARTVSRWLAACDGLIWSADAAPEGPHLLVTDEEAASADTPSLRFDPPRAPQASVSRWLVAAEHPIGAYLSPLERVSAAINPRPEETASGIPVVQALVQGRRVPVILAQDHGARQVILRLDPSATPQSTPVLLAFYNSLRWLMADGVPAGDNFIDPLESNLLTPASTWRSPRTADAPPRARPAVWHPLAHLLLWALLILLMLEWRLFTRKRA